jgi:hypothetical protein
MVDVFIGLATAVVKAGVKIWLKDDSFAANASASVGDFVAGKSVMILINGRSDDSSKTWRFQLPIGFVG